MKIGDWTIQQEVICGMQVYTYSHDNYDGAPDSDTRHLSGWAPTLSECAEEIEGKQEELEARARQ